MRTKNIFKTVALAMLMPAMLLTTACSNQDDVANTSNITNKGYALPVTVNVTRGDGATRASYNESTGKLSFSAGDQLFVYSNNQDISGAGKFAGTLDYVPATGKFSGIIYTENSYDNTADALFTAAAAEVGPTHIKAYLLPAGYEGYGFLSIYGNGTSSVLYDDQISEGIAFVASETAKATGVEQLSLEEASTYSTGFALEPQKAILNFTIYGLDSGEKNVDLVAHYGYYGGPYHVTGKVTPNASGVATFAIGVPAGATLENMADNLTVGSNSFTLPSSTTFTAGKIYNIARSATGNIINLAKVTENTVAQNGDILIGTLGANVKISIADGATVTLNNVTINGTNNYDYEWAGITCEGDATIILNGTNTVKGFYTGCPGIHVYGDPVNPSNNKTLTIKGSGSLTASSNGGGAGIGGGWYINCGNIEIQDGTITATGGEKAAGIGGGNGADCGTITISGGSVTATGSNLAAGIGSGNGESCGAITISGGTITATGGNDAAGIGGGNDADCGTITISGGSVTATCGKGGAGIGSGPQGLCGAITISGGTVTATGGEYAAGIGSGEVGLCGNINITSGVTHVTATKGSKAPNSIGIGYSGTCGTVTIGDNEGAITDSPYTYQP